MKMRKFVDFCAYAVPRCFIFQEGPATITALFSITTEAMTMAEAEMLKMIRRITGASQAAGKQEATQPTSNHNDFRYS